MLFSKIFVIFSVAEKWECYECNKKFRTPSQLQKHYALHLAQHKAAEEESLDNDDDTDAVSDVTEASAGMMDLSL